MNLSLSLASAFAINCIACAGDSIDEALIRSVFVELIERRRIFGVFFSYKNRSATRGTEKKRERANDSGAVRLLPYWCLRLRSARFIFTFLVILAKSIRSTHSEEMIRRNSRWAMRPRFPPLRRKLRAYIYIYIYTYVYMYRDFRDPVFVSYFRAPLIHAGGRNARRTTPSANRGSTRRRDTTMRFAITEDNALSSAATLASLFSHRHPALNLVPQFLSRARISACRTNEKAGE